MLTSKKELLIKKNVYVQNKYKGKKNQNKVNEARTVENIKYEPILSWSSDFIYRDL